MPAYFFTLITFLLGLRDTVACVTNNGWWFQIFHISDLSMLCQIFYLCFPKDNINIRSWALENIRFVYDKQDVLRLSDANTRDAMNLLKTCSDLQGNIISVYNNNQLPSLLNNLRAFFSERDCFAPPLSVT